MVGCIELHTMLFDQAAPTTSLRERSLMGESANEPWEYAKKSDPLWQYLKNQPEGVQYLCVMTGENHS